MRTDCDNDQIARECCTESTKVAHRTRKSLQCYPRRTGHPQLEISYRARHALISGLSGVRRVSRPFAALAAMTEYEATASLPTHILNRRHAFAASRRNSPELCSPFPNFCKSEYFSANDLTPARASIVRCLPDGQSHRRSRMPGRRLDRRTIALQCNVITLHTGQ